MKYVIVTPVKNEEPYIQKTIQSLIRQTLKPAEWIIVDDGSEDETFDRANNYSGDYGWIKVIHHDTKNEQRSGGAKVVRAFNFGYARLTVRDYDFIVKMDGDIELPEDYFESVANEFKKDDQLGVCGGIILNKIGDQLIQEGDLDYHVRGAFKAYKKACFEQIGGLKLIWNWDGIDEMEAMYVGWRTKTIPKYVVHFRPTTNAYDPIKHAYKSGYEAYRMRNSLLLTLLRTVYRISKKPLILNAFSYLKGYITALSIKESRHIDKDLAKFINHFHIRRVIRKFIRIR